MPWSQTFRKSKRLNFSKKIYSRRYPLFFILNRTKMKKKKLKNGKNSRKAHFFYYKRKWEMGTMETDFYFGQG